MYYVRRGKKLLGALIGGVVGSQVDWVTNQVFGVDWTAQQDTAVAVLLAMIGTWLAPANAPKRPPAGEQV